MVLATAWIKAAVSPEKLYHHHGLSAPLSRVKTPPSITAHRTGRIGTLSDQQASPIRSVAEGAETFRFTVLLLFRVMKKLYSFENGFCCIGYLT